MLIKVKIQNKQLKIKDCKGLSSARGLMFDSMQDKDGALIHGNNIWMLFVKQPLDLLFLDRNFKILDIQRAVPLTFNPRTWKIYFCTNASYCLELKAGTVKAKLGIKLTII